MKKSLVAILAVLTLVLPLTKVGAISGNYYVYGAGDEVNFYAYTGDTKGQKTIIISDEGAESQYVKTIALAPYGDKTTVYYDNSESYKDQLPGTAAQKVALEAINKVEAGWDHAKDIKENMTNISLDELKTVFGATANEDGTYSISVDKWGKFFAEEGIYKLSYGQYAADNRLGTYLNGFYTSTYNMETGKVWVVKFAYDTETLTENSKLTKITVVEEEMNQNNNYGYLPVVYFDKTYDCTERQVSEKYACYSCSGDYTWTTVGSQAETCTLVENVTKKSDCATTVPTGVEDYILEFAGVAAVCVVALVIVKRKDLFRSI